MKRVAAVVLPELACELVRQRASPGKKSSPAPIAVILGPSDLEANGSLPATATLDVVSEEARRYGVRPGQGVAEATAIVAHLAIHRVTYEELGVALGRVAEIALAFGPTAAIELEAGSSDPALLRDRFEEAPRDTVWLDVTGAAHLVGGEDALLAELVSRVSALGHRARVAIADGPRLAQALARWSMEGERAIAPPGEGARAIAGLPIRALPIDAEIASFFLRVGVLLVSDLVRLPRPSLAARLGPRAAEVLALAGGHDPTPLLPYAAPRVLVEEIQFEEGTELVEPLLFVLRGMTSRLAARLGARGEAATRLELTVSYDRSIAEFRAAAAGRAPVLTIDLVIDLPSPLAREADLLRPLRTKLEATRIEAPAIGVRLAIPQIVRAPRIQLDLSRDVAVSPDALPALLAELSAEIGAERLGVLTIVDAHRPEARSLLSPPIAPPARRGSKKARSTIALDVGPDEAEPARLLPSPIRIGQVREGSVIAIEQRLYAVERVEFVMRLDAVEWWTESPSSRDYARAWLVAGDRFDASASRLHDGAARPKSRAPATTMEALIFVDRVSGEYFLQGFCE